MEKECTRTLQNIKMEDYKNVEQNIRDTNESLISNVKQEADDHFTQSLMEYQQDLHFISKDEIKSFKKKVPCVSDMNEGCTEFDFKEMKHLPLEDTKCNISINEPAIVDIDNTSYESFKKEVPCIDVIKEEYTGTKSEECNYLPLEDTKYSIDIKETVTVGTDNTLSKSLWEYDTKPSTSGYKSDETAENMKEQKYLYDIKRTSINVGSEDEHFKMSESSSDESETSDSDIESNASDSDNLSSARMWCPISTENLTPPLPRFQFLGASGSTFEMKDEFDILEYFKLFFDDEILNIIVTETNRYAHQEPGSVPWSPITKDEILVFLSINILQGIIRKPDERMYWSTRETLSTPIFARLMSQRRYLQIKKNLHFYDNEAYNENTHPCPKLYKIWPIFVNINSKFSSLYIPDRDITVDESLMLYKGRLGWVQYIPLKCSRFGIKVFLLCESKSGYLYSSIIYTGKGTVFSDKYKNMPFTSQVVLTLADTLLDQGYCLTTGNFYTSPQLANYLISRKTDIYGTVRVNRKDIPNELRQEKLNKGETISFQKAKTMIMNWHDNRDICLLSTIHNPEKVATKKKDKQGNIIMKPKVVMDYNHTMGGGDRLDQHLHDYPIPKKRGKKYYKKIFFHLLDFSIFNAFILYQKNGGKRSNLDFRIKLVESLIEKHHSGISTSKHGRPKLLGPLRLTERHFCEFVPPTPKKAVPYRHCAVCCNQRDKKGKKSRKETRYYCRPCNVGLCAVPCFMIYHTKSNF